MFPYRRIVQRMFFIPKLETKNVVLLTAIWEAFYIPRDADNAVYPRIWAYCKKLYLSAVRYFYAHKKTATAAGRLRFFLFFIRAISDGRAFGGLCRTCLSMKFCTSP